MNTTWLLAFITRTIIFPAGVLIETSYLVRFLIILISLLIFYFSKKNLVYPTILSAILLGLFNSYYG